MLCCEPRTVITPYMCAAVLCSQVKQLSSEDVEHRELFRRNVSHGQLKNLIEANGVTSHHDGLEPTRLSGMHGCLMASTARCLWQQHQCNHCWYHLCLVSVCVFGEVYSVQFCVHMLLDDAE